MSAATALFKKDMLLGRTVFFAALLMNAVCIVIGYTSGDWYYIPLLIAVSLHLLYFPVTMFVSLLTESRQLHIWLHSPRSAVALLLSKIGSGALFTVGSLALLYVFGGLLTMTRFDVIELYWPDIRWVSVLVFVSLPLAAILLGIWVILCWSLYHALKHRIGRLAWFVLLAVIVLSNWIGDLFSTTELYRLLTHWGGWEMSFATFTMELPVTVYLGEHLLQLLLAAGVFYLSAWLIDRKVEV